MSDDHYDPPLTGHTYDGIQEYDNPTPSWWTYIFILSIVYAVAYMAYYHFGTVSQSIAQGYEADRAADLKKRFASMGELLPDEATMLQVMSSPDMLAAGRSVFSANCVSCHNQKGEGLVGPNLTDDKFINIKTLVDIPKVITEGANNNAMPAWKGRIHPNEIMLVAGYVATLRGENLPGLKWQKPENEIAPWPTSAAAPATPPTEGETAPDHNAN